MKPGGLRDPVAQSIRNEMQQDAAPHPDEAREEKRRALSEEGCRGCGEDDPDKLEFGIEEEGSGYARQMYQYVECEDCRKEE